MQDWEITILTAVGALVLCLITIGLTLIFSRRSDRKKEEPAGTLHVAEDPDDGAYLWLELNRPVEDILPEKAITLWVDVMLSGGVTANEAAEAIQGINRL